MKIILNEQAIAWFENKFPLNEGEAIRFFGKTYGQTEVHEGFSMGIQLDNFKAHDDILASTTVNDRTYFTIKEDQWFFEGYDLEIGIDDHYKEPSYHFTSQDPSQEIERPDGVSSPSKK